jgi:hypothetical protein
MIYPVLRDTYLTDEEAKFFVYNNRNQLFFQKHLDWIGENEYRFITLDPSIEYLHFDIGLRKIIIGERCNERDFFDLSRLLRVKYQRERVFKLKFKDNSRDYELKEVY